jgi:hypothetical protein
MVGRRSVQGIGLAADFDRRDGDRHRRRHGAGTADEGHEMNILLGFSPFLVFIILNGLVGVETGLIGAAMMSGLLLARELLVRRQVPKVLEIGTAVLFGGLALVGPLLGGGWSIALVRFAIDAGLLLIVLISIVIGQPFTLQYAREQVPRTLWDHPTFRRVNLVITAVWAAAFAIMAAADLAWMLIPGLPPRVVIIVTVAALAGAAKFTSWYPARQRAAAVAAADR